MEIERYLKGRKFDGRPRVALDDDARLFPADCPNLILCRHGFGDEEEAELRRVLEDHGRQTVGVAASGR